MDAPNRHDPGKILSHATLLELRAEARRQGRRVVHCHGCFDIVHPGHVRHLRDAKSLGDILLVSLTGDAAVAKGAGRPLIPQELRAENLAELDCVDWVLVEPRPTAEELLGEVQPDVYVKGREYESNRDPRFQAERDAVERHGGRVVFSSGDVVFSSSALIAAIDHGIDPYHKQLAQLLEQEELQAASLAGRIAEFRGKRVLIVGETILDTYVLCDRPDVAGESPVMTLRPVERRHYDGGAAIIARHLAAMGAKPILVTAMPEDEIAGGMRRRLTAAGVEVHALPVDVAVAEKQRFLVGTHKVVKIDLLDPITLDAAAQDRLVELTVGVCGEGVDGAIVADFGQGMLTSGVLSRLTKRLRGVTGVLVGDVSGRRSTLRAMKSMDLVCPSEQELRDAYAQHDDSLPSITWRMLHETDTRYAMVTMGAEGLIAFDRLPPGATERDQAWQGRLSATHVPSMSPMAVDPLGCGDALIATATLTLASGGSFRAASFLGSIAAATQAQRVGNIPVSSTDLRQGVNRVHAAHLAFAVPDVLDARQAREPGSSSPAVLA